MNNNSTYHPHPPASRGFPVFAFLRLLMLQLMLLMLLNADNAGH